MTRSLRILVTDAENRASLAVTRSLGRAGHHVCVAHHYHPTLASSSRHCKERVVVPDATRDPEAFARGVQEAVSTLGLDAIIPASDISTLTIAGAARDGLITGRLCLPPCETLELAADKRRTFELGLRLGVPVPRTWILEDTDSPLPDVPLPLVVKPARSRVWHQGTWHFGSVCYAASSKELLDILMGLSPAQFPVLLQERIQGPGVGVFACYDRGQLVALFSHRRIREKPPSGGVSVLRESVPLDPAAEAHTRAMLEALQWHGVAMVEFKLDQRDHTPKLMEINGRLWGSLQLAIDAGVDFPRLMSTILAGERPNPVRTYRTGIRSRWLWGDIDALLALFLKPRRQLHLPPDHPGRLQTLASFLVPWHPGLHYEVMSLSDPKPWLYETRRRFRSETRS